VLPLQKLDTKSAALIAPLVWSQHASS
jgi:hypothetical protein